MMKMKMMNKKAYKSPKIQLEIIELESIIASSCNNNKGKSKIDKNSKEENWIDNKEGGNYDIKF